MNVVVLDGTSGTHPVTWLLSVLAEELAASLVHFPLAELQIAPCLGDFECWVKTPGICRTRDVIGEIMQAMQTADLVVFVSPVVFGAYSAALKKAVDRLIGLIHPFFKAQDGLTRHFPRYERYPRLLVIGIADRPDDEAADIFREMAAGNAINLQAPASFTRLISPGAIDWHDDIERAFRNALESSTGETSPPPSPDTLLRACAADSLSTNTPPAPRRATILIGSARPKGSSTSESLARQLMEDLTKENVESSMVYINQFIKAGAAAERGLEAMLAADLLVIAAPIYVDSLPSLVCQALEQLAARFDPQRHALRRVCGIINCGYPEAIHNRIAMRQLRNFAHRTHLIWSGGLALGGGEIIHGRPLRSLRFIFRTPIRALQLAAEAIARGQPIPPAATRLMARPLVPSWLFRWAAHLRWTIQARAHGNNWRQLAARPYATTPPAGAKQAATTDGSQEGQKIRSEYNDGNATRPPAQPPHPEQRPGPD